MLYLIGFESLGGNIRDIRMDKIEISGKIRGPSHIFTRGKGKCSNITISNLRAAGKPVTTLETKLSKGAEAPILR